MGKVVQLDEFRVRTARARGDRRGARDPWAPQLQEFEWVEGGSGWYHEEAIRTSKPPSTQPR